MIVKSFKVYILTEFQSLSTPIQSVFYKQQGFKKLQIKQSEGFKILNFKATQYINTGVFIQTFSILQFID